MKRLGLLFLLALPLPAFAQKQFGFDNRKGSGQPYLTPEETVKKFKVAPEFEVKLFAGEPDCVNPVAFTIDEKGRVWVLECFEYPSRTPKGKQPRDRIVILEDTDGDGKCDKRTVFAEGKDFPISDERKKAGLGAFDLATGLEVGNGGVYVGAPPYLWFIENKDDKPGKFERLAGGFGSQDTHETLNTFQWGPDGWLYGMQGVFTNSTVKPLDGPETRMNAAVWRLHPETKKFEIFAEGTSNPWGLDWRNTDGQFILAACVIPHLYHIVPGGIYKRQAGASYNPYAYGYINEICDHTFHKESGWAHAGLLSLDVPHMPKKYQNSVIFGSIHGCSLKQNILKPNGSSYTASKGEDFLVSGDKNFRPINMKWGPHGDIYLIDWHDQMPCHQARADQWDYERGRVYRIQLKDRKGGKAEDLGKKKPAELVAMARSDDPYTYRAALRLLGELSVAGRAKATEAAKAAFVGARPDQRTVVRSSLVAGPLGRMTDEKAGTFMLTDGQVRNSPLGSEWIVRACGHSAGVTPQTIDTFSRLAAGAASPAVRRELASAAIRLADKHDVTALVHALMKNKDDAKDPLIPHLTWLAYEKVISKKDGANSAARVEKELAFLAKEAPDNIFVRNHIVPKVMRRLVATGQPADLAACVKFVAAVTDTNTREKALDGLATALAGRTVTAPEAWAKLEPELRKDARLTGLVNKLAVAFRDPAAVKRALDIAGNTQLPAEARAEAVRQLAVLKPDAALQLLASLIGKSANTPDPLRAEAVRAMTAFDNAIVPTTLLNAWADLSPVVRAEAVNTLSSRKEWAKLLLKAMDAKKIERTAVTDNTVIKMQAFNDKEINSLIEKAWGRVRNTPAELNKLIDKTRAGLDAAPASFARGKLVFEAQCMKCHKFDGKGNEVGPQLDGAGRDIEYLLANVLDPNRVIGAPYFLRTANNLDGQVIQGILAEEDDNFLTLKVEGAKLVKLAKKDIDGPVKVQEKSMMPEGLTASMTEQNFRDLIRYVMKDPYMTDVKVNDKAVSAGVTGRLPLPAGKGTTVVAEFTAASAFKTKLLVNSTDPFAVTLDGKPVGSDVTLSAGKHTLTMTRTGDGKAGAVSVRLLDPDRKLSYPEGK